ncbi:gamma-glutamyltransferase [Azohydromonas caseinilytica]|uniref:Glutathione hydrolase proenzyme n=1 Tax=Azohydromonas caseinilytica TaxID=2728836 RepID=A0A848FBE0_9BURK|nr:gamma-glutamyltransferase [Azohydromonas caseinilytica]NML16642.1 gamma-glutamyltransferase [Azohydromonas caseinilytica]
MPALQLVSLRPSRLCRAALLACGGIAIAAQAATGVSVEAAVSLGKLPPIPGAPRHQQAVVAVSNPYGAEAGAQVLEKGGNAIDAAVAIAYALNVVEPQSAGIGGGGFMMIHHAASGRTFYIDSREKAPAGATPSMFAGVPNPSLQGVAVGVPGMVRGTALALEQFGNMKLSQVLKPAIKLADKGFKATPRYSAASCNNRSQNSPEAAAFFCPNGSAPPVGTLIKNRPLADTLRLIAAHGADCFYVYLPTKGCDIAKGIVEGQKFGRGGSMSYADLQNYRPALRTPVEGRYRGYLIKAMPPPSSGGLTVLQMLDMLERFPLGDESKGYGFATPKTANVMASAMRIAFADRAVWMGDADFVPVPSRGLLHPSYVGLRGAPILPTVRLSPDPMAGDPRPYQNAGVKATKPLAVAAPVNGPGETTTHFSVIDRWGNLVSYTNTIESSHGIGVFAGYRKPDGSFRNHGFLLNNELTDFNLLPTTNPYTGTAGYNDVQPNKRPRSSMTPVMMFTPDGRPLLAYGSPGGSTIINSVLNVTLNLVDHRMGLQQAIDAPRLSVTSAGSTVSLEAGMPQATVDALKGLGYTVGVTEIGSVQAVGVDPRTGRYYGGADNRREGTVITLPRGKPLLPWVGDLLAP